MPFFSGVEADSGVRDILALNPAAGRALIEYQLTRLTADALQRILTC